MSEKEPESPLPLNFEAIAEAVNQSVQRSQGDCLQLLALLRMLEGLHREVCDGPFQASLPTNRQALYALLRDIEAEGGWPYIHRMKLQGFLANLTTEPEAGEATEAEASVVLHTEADVPAS